MYMFETFLSSIPSNRSDMVNDLEIPEIPLTPYIWEPEPVSDNSSLETITIDEPPPSLSTDSSIPLSRAMTDSDIDYDWCRKYKRLDLSDPWQHMRTAWAAFPPDHIDTLNRLSLQPSLSTVDSGPESSTFEPFPSQDLLWRSRRFIEEECCVYGPDDPGLLELEEVLQSIDLEKLYLDLDIIV